MTRSLNISTAIFRSASFDSRLNRLIVARDRLGIRPVCYTRAGDTFLFASNAKAILAAPGVTAVPDAATLADFVLSFLPADAATRTFFEGVHSLPAAHFLVVTPARSRFTDTSTSIRSSGSGSRAWPDYVDAFHELFSASVCHRLRSATPVAVTVSGGLDSAYIFCVAARPRSSGRRALSGCSRLQLRGPCRIAFGRARVRQRRSRRHVECRSLVSRSSAGSWQAAELSVWHTESPTVESLTCQAQSGMRRMREAGAGRLLTGHWGDQVLFDSDYLLDLLRSGQWRLLQQHLRGWGVSAPRLAIRVGRTIAAGHLPARFKLAFRRVCGSDEGDPWRAPWFTPRFRRVLRDRAACARLTIPPGTSHAARSTVRAGWGITSTAWSGTIALPAATSSTSRSRIWTVRCSSS